jgi:hypothetical protein
MPKEEEDKIKQEEAANNPQELDEEDLDKANGGSGLGNAGKIAGKYHNDNP